jgi:hypothetical protein
VRKQIQVLIGFYALSQTMHMLLSINRDTAADLGLGSLPSCQPSVFWRPQRRLDERIMHLLIPNRGAPWQGCHVCYDFAVVSP